ncbi:MAG TPA: gas vesicle protein GvpG [Chloroflexota bacterium]|nr:gas vesicle protein GvpG [Chloroflexota bacterium]
MLLKLLGLPVTLPAAGIKFCLEQVRAAAEAELNDPEPVKEALLLLQLKLEEGEITEEEYAAEEATLMQRLREIRATREAQARREREARGGAGESASGWQVSVELPPEVTEGGEGGRRAGA